MLYIDNTYIKEIIVLLCGGDKTTQQEDIKEAKKIAADYNPDEED